MSMRRTRDPKFVSIGR